LAWTATKNQSLTGQQVKSAKASGFLPPQKNQRLVGLPPFWLAFVAERYLQDNAFWGYEPTLNDSGLAPTFLALHAS